MAATELVESRAPLPGTTRTDLRERSVVWPHLPTVIALALLAVVAYAAFAEGGVGRATDTRLELIVAGVSAVGALGWLWLGTLRLNAPRVTLAGVGLLGVFACWSGASVVWSVAPDATWIELNRVITYALVVLLGIAVGASMTRGVELVARGFMLVAFIVTLYALGQKLVPGLHVAGVFDLNRTGPLPRLQDPFGYWNALALFIAMGTPIALGLAADSGRGARWRLAAAAVLQLMLITIPFTYSRGGLIATAVALGVGAGLSAARLRSLLWLGAALLSALPAILVGLLVHDLSAASLPLDTREGAGGILALVVVSCLAVLILAGLLLIRIEARVTTSPRLPALRRLALAGAVALVLGVLVALALSPRGLPGTISDLWHGFATTHVTSGYNPERLLSTVSENRWVWWREAGSAFTARPAQGWGAGSFPVVHLLYRHDTLPVQQPHSVPLQFLAETGVIGGLLGVGAFLVLAVGAVGSVRSRLPGRERLLAAALVGSALAYGVHCLYDWDWNIPALSLPTFLFLGVVAGARARGLDQAAAGRVGRGLRGLGLAAATLWLCIFALSVALPQLAADKASGALVAASSRSGAAVQQAESDATLASSLDPLSDAGVLAQATLALHVGQRQRARLYLQDAVARDPSDAQAWRFLAVVDGQLRRLTDGRAAGQHAIRLDPLGSFAALVLSKQVAHAPPSGSATRFATPGGPGR
ncbi:MAG: O-antigen ligase family protein [Solirubrobacteraceae bacterium]